MATDFATRVLVFYFDAMVAGKHVLRSTVSRPAVITTDITLQHTSRPSLLPLLHCKAMIVFCKHRIYLGKFRSGNYGVCFIRGRTMSR